MTVAAQTDNWPWAEHKTLARDAQCYETPEWAIDAMLDAELLTSLVVEPCCGRGALAEAAVVRGYRVDAFDLHDWGYGRAGIDFLQWRFAECHLAAAEPWTCLMHPPFDLALAFAEHALEQGARKVVLFQRLALWQGRRRRAFWTAHPPARIHLCESRANCWRVDVAPHARRGRRGQRSEVRRAPYAWFVFEQGQPAGTLIARLQKPAAGVAARP